MKKFNLTDLCLLIIWLVPIIYLITIYDKLPAIVAIHYGIDGKPNGYGPRSTMILLQAIISGVAAGLFFLMRYMPLIDPKSKEKYGDAVFRKIAVIMVVFLSGISLMILYATVEGQFKFDGLLLAGLSVMFALMGNVMYNVKPNYFVGIRLPWTLEDPNNWRATHRVAGKVWVTGGIIMALLMIFLSGEIRFTIFIAGTLLICLIPSVYSYRYFKTHTQHAE